MLAEALLVVVAAPSGGVPGTTHAAWQDAAWELHVIMQVVVIDDCASRIVLPRLAANAAPGHPARIRTTIMMTRLTLASPFNEGSHHSSVTRLRKSTTLSKCSRALPRSRAPSRAAGA